MRDNYEVLEWSREPYVGKVRVLHHFVDPSNRGFQLVVDEKEIWENTGVLAGNKHVEGMKRKPHDRTICTIDPAALLAGARR